MTWAEAPWEDPAHLLQDLGIDHPRDIDVEAIAEYSGATIVYETLHGCAARILARGDRAFITVDRSAHPFRRRFSAAHELGHWMLDRGTTAFACTDGMMRARGSGDNPELRANRWAAGLLMPEGLFDKDAYGLPLTFDMVRYLAKRYRTSLVATAIRMVRASVELSSMIICSRPGKRWSWFYRSPLMPSVVWPLDQPGPGSLAYRLFRREKVTPGPKMVKWKEWIQLEDPPLLYYLVEDSMLLSDGRILTLLGWADETPLFDIYDAQPPHRRRMVGERG